MGLPKEKGSTNNTTLSGLKEVILEYQSELERAISSGFSGGSARHEARVRMAEYDYEGRTLGFPAVKKDQWIQCGIVEGEEGVPEELKSSYCGKWFHFECMGLLREPKDQSERIQCLRCLQDRRYRAKIPPIEHVLSVCAHASNGKPRLIEEDAKSKIRTLHLICDCPESVGVGLPCAGQLAVARICNAVISYHSYHPHWWGSKILVMPPPEAVFSSNEKHILDIKAVEKSDEKQDPPSRRGDNVTAPTVPRVKETSLEGEPSFHVTTENDDGEVLDLSFGCDDDHVFVGGTKMAKLSSRKKSRRFKSKKAKQDK